MDLYVTSDSYTRPANTTAYAAGDAVSDSTSEPTVLTFSNAAGKAGRGGYIQALKIVSSAYTAVADPGGLAGEVILFDTAPTALEDNAAADLSDAEMLNSIGFIAFDFDTNGVAGTATAGAGGNTLVTIDDINLPFKCADGSRTLYGVIVARNAYVPVSGEVITVELVIDRESW